MKYLITHTLCFMYLLHLFCPGLLFATDRQQLQTQIAVKTNELRQQQQVINTIQRERNEIDREYRQLQIRLAGQKAQMERALKQLVDKHQLVIKHPELTTDAERARYAAAKEAYDTLEFEFTNAEARLALVDADLESAQNSAALIQSDIQAVKDKIADLNFARFRQQIEQERTVRARGEFSCGDMSIIACKRAAMELAQRNAAESGSAVIIDSFTQVRDFQLERDDISSRMQAVVLSHEIIEEGFIGHSGFFYEISALVKGQIPVEYFGDFRKMAYYLPVEEPKPVVSVEPSPPPPAPTAATYQLIVTAQPSHARINFIDPVIMAYTPGMQLPPGDYLVEAAADGYISRQARIQIVNRDVTHTITLDPVPVTEFKLTIRTVPKGARIVFVDPAMDYTDGMKLEPGEYQVEVSSNGFLPRRESIRIAKSDLTHTVKLNRAPPAQYRLFIETSPANAQIRILNIRPVFTQGIELTSGPYHVEVSADGYETFREWIQIDNSDIRHKVALTALPPPQYRLTIQTVPRNAQVALRQPALTYRDGMALEAGKYLVAVTAEGYHPREEWIEIVNRDVTRTIALVQLPPTQYQLTIQTVPRNAQVAMRQPALTYRDGMALEAGKYLVAVSADGYATTLEWVEIVDSDVTRTIVLSPLPPSKHRLTIRPVPKDAAIRLVEPAAPYIEGMQLSPGDYVVEVAAEGFEPKQVVVQISTSDVTRTIELDRITPSAFRLYVQADPPEAQIRIMNIRTPFEQGIELPPGSYQLEVSAADYETREEWIQITDRDVVHPIKLVRLSPTRYQLRVQTKPSDARVAIKDPPMTYQDGMSLEPGRYLVEVSARGYVTQQDWIEISDADASISLALKQVPAPAPPPVDDQVVARDRHLLLLPSGVVRDTRTGLEWYMGADRDILRRNAVNWAESLTVDGGGWRLPERAELETLFERGQGTRNMSSLFNTRGWYFWASDAAMAPFDFSGGSQRWHQLRPARDSRVLAVRKP